jgi:dTDP-glucose pyrophosphorylase
MKVITQLQEKTCIFSDRPMREALQLLNQLSGVSPLFVLDQQNRLIGTLSDRDIRNGLLKGLQLEDAVSLFMDANFVYVTDRSFTDEQVASFRQSGLNWLPILDEQQQIIELIDLRFQQASLPLDVLIMAGGQGQRLRPWTENTPKPLLPVGEKPILGHILDLLAKYGIQQVHICTGYRGKQIEETIGSSWDPHQEIRYYHEGEALGTIGGARLVENWTHEYILVMNADLLTNINLSHFFRAFVEREADMAIATTRYEHQVPYAVLETHYGQVYNLKEKPQYRYHANAGIYLLKRSDLDHIPYGTFFNATDLVQKMLEKGRKVIPVPLNGYWLDIGTPEDYRQAQQDLRHISLKR